MTKVLLITFLLTGVCFAQTSEDEIEKERILKLYGNKTQYNSTLLRSENAELLKKLQVNDNLLYTRINLITHEIQSMSDMGTEKSEEEIQNTSKITALKTSKYRELLNQSSKVRKFYKSNSDSRSQINLKELKVMLTKHISDGHNLLSEKINMETLLDTGEEVPEQDDIMAAIETTLGEDVVEDSFMSGIMSKKMKDTANIMMKQNPFSLMSKDELRQMFLDKTRGTAGGNYLRKSKRTLRVMVEVCHDKDAIPKFVSLINKPKKMKTYGFSFLGVIIFVFFINMKNAKAGLIKKFAIKFALMGFATSINCLSFYLIFKEELAPTIAAFQRAW
jgi:hypothetical protein